MKKEPKPKTVGQEMISLRFQGEIKKGCDQCGKEIPEYPNEPSKLEITIFHQDKESTSEHFCSWRCVLNRLPSVESDHFVRLPFIHFDVRKGERGADSLIEILKKLP